VRFGVSTHLYHASRLCRDHLVEVAGHGFAAVELFATRTHFDYHDSAAIDALARWLDDTGLRLHSVHAPINESYVDGVWGAGLSTAFADKDRRGRTIDETRRALEIARRIPFEFLVIHLGTPDTYGSAARDNDPESAKRSVEELHAIASPLGVRLALEIVPNRISSIDALLRLIDDELELRDTGLCLDFGHAHLMDGVVNAIEEASGHVFTTHVHDNHGRSDDHLVPFEGRIDWGEALFAMQKVGYEGVFLFEVANTGSALDVLARTRDACRRFEEILTY
jgi:sugar phosphate isomerase/epimerase